MNITTLPVPAPTGQQTDEVKHYYCCDPNTAWCGLDIRSMAPAKPGETECPLCLYADGQGLPCCDPLGVGIRLNGGAR